MPLQTYGGTEDVRIVRPKDIQVDPRAFKFFMICASVTSVGSQAVRVKTSDQLTSCRGGVQVPLSLPFPRSPAPTLVTMPSCAERDCCNYSKGKSKYFRFPKHKETQERWIQLCGRKDHFNPTTQRVCSKHFDEAAFKRIYFSTMNGILC